jgi:hypothetical protein
VDPERTAHITLGPTARRGIGQFALFAGVAFGPVAVLYALGFRAAADSAREALDSTIDPIRVVGLSFFLAALLVGTYHLWKRAGDRFVRAVVLLGAYELLFFALPLLLNTYLLAGPPWLDWPGHPFVPVLGMVATMFFYAQALIFPLAVVATMIVGGRVQASCEPVSRKAGFRGVITAVLAAVLPAVLVVAIHLRFAQPYFMMNPLRFRALTAAADDLSRAMDRYAAAHSGFYPPADVSWEPGDSTSMAYWFQPYDDGWHRDSSNTPDGHLPDNPFTGRSYRLGVDLFYFPDSLRNSGDNRRHLAEKGGHVAFAEMKAPKGRLGTIVILGYVPPHAVVPQATEYALVLFANDVNEPWHDSRPSKDYFVLCGPKVDSEPEGK